MAGRRTIADLLEAKRHGKKIVAVSCYDFTTAGLVAQADVDMIIVGDSAGQHLLGFENTLPVGMDFMLAITGAVRRAAPGLCIVADMPFLSYQVDKATAIRNAGRFITEAGADMVKMEVSKAYLDTLKAVADAGIAVMAHIGIRPQYIGQTGRLKAEATTAQEAIELIRLAEQLPGHGACAILLEGTACEVASMICRASPVPVIGCGSGAGCDGQVLIAADILGLTSERPRFAVAFADLAVQVVRAIAAYSHHVRAGTFPDQSHSYHLKPGQMELLDRLGKAADQAKDRQ
ncbi:MAG: 3-methyl-2-oxobutanoate hydroxymethyltransferase [Sedimentisphaerales bacterium]|nr:3-methyl-2-oxobutanoate hydroxymethyltransferase [Sedimentisphaerales bacterium]